MHQPAARTFTVVLVEGRSGYCHAFEQAFRVAQPGTAFFPHTSAQRAIEYLALCGQRYPMPDLVLVNRALPDGEDGYLVLRALAALAKLSTLPVLVMGPDEEPASVQAAVAAGAAGYLMTPPDVPSLVGFVRDVLAWWQRRQGALLLDTCRTTPAHESSLAVPDALPSLAAMTPALAVPAPAAASPDHPLTQFHGLLQAFYGYVAGGNAASTIGLFADRKLVELTRVCREEGIEEADALDDSRDPVLMIKRGRVIRRLMSLEWSDTELLRKFRRARSTIKEQRRLWRIEQAQSNRTLPGRGLN